MIGSIDGFSYHIFPRWGPQSSLIQFYFNLELNTINLSTFFQSPFNSGEHMHRIIYTFRMPKLIRKKQTSTLIIDSEATILLLISRYSIWATHLFQHR